MATHAAELNMIQPQVHTGLRAIFARIAEGCLQALERHANNTPFARKIRALEAKTDAELAAMGVTRAEIPQLALGAAYYI